MSKVSGPLLDRIDTHIEVPSVKYKDLSDESAGEKSEIIRERVKIARNIQLLRFKDDGIFANSHMSHKLARRYCKLDDAGIY